MTKNDNGCIKPDCFFLIKETKCGNFCLERICSQIIQAQKTSAKLPFFAFFGCFEHLMQLLGRFSSPYMAYMTKSSHFLFSIYANMKLGPLFWKSNFFPIPPLTGHCAITCLNIGQITKSKTFFKSTLDGLLKNAQLLFLWPFCCWEMEVQKALTVLLDSQYNKFTHFGKPIYLQIQMAADGRDEN